MTAEEYLTQKGFDISILPTYRVLELMEEYHQYKKGQERSTDETKKLRDEFAMNSVNGLLSNEHTAWYNHIDRLVDKSYEIASKMMERRKQ